MSSIRCINADQNTLTIFKDGWAPENVGYVLNVIHNGEPVPPYPGGFSAVLRELRQALPHCEMASYISLSYVKDLSESTTPPTPRRTLAADAFTAEELNGDGTINYRRNATCRKAIGLMRAELCWRRDTEDLRSVWFDDYPAPFDSAKLDFYVWFIGWLRDALKLDGISSRVNASNLFYGSQTEGELVALAKCCDGICLEGEKINDELADPARFNYRLQVLANYQSAITLMAPPSCNDKDKYDEWCETAVDVLQPALDTGKVFIGYPPQWEAPKWAED